MSIEISELDAMQSAYMDAMEVWTAAIREEEALAIVLGKAANALRGEVNAVACADDGVGIDRIGEPQARTEGLAVDRLR